MKVILSFLLLAISLSSGAEITIQPYGKSYSWKNEWSQALKEELKKDDFSKGDKAFLNIEVDEEDLDKLECDGYNKATAHEKAEFWIAFFSALTRAESAFNPKAVSGKSRGHRSYGLLQLARATAYNKCAMDPKGQAVYNPEENLKCGLKLMHWQLQGAPTKSGKKLRSDLEGQIFGKNIFQWGPLRQDDHRGRKLLVDWFKAHLKQLPFCQRKS